MHEIVRTIAEIKEFRAAILSRRDTPLLRGSLRDVRRLVIINSSSRSGSSLLYTLLGKLPHVYCLTGEAAPFYKLNATLGGFNPHASDRIPDALLDRVIDFPGLSRDFLADLACREPSIACRDIDADTYVDDLMLRLALQWTTITFEPAALRRSIGAALDAYVARHAVFNAEEFYLELLERLMVLWPQINPFYYDIGTDKVALRFPFLEVPVGPPVAGFTLEEPPFILLSPFRKPTPADLAGKTLLLKSTVDCYRMNLIEKLFPDTEIRIIHLVRNPAATINGIYDGWHHRGFFSHNLSHDFTGDESPELRIRGYSDRYPFGSTWWNFDLPDGWQRMVDRDLVEVCAFQWHGANTEILRHLAATHRPSCRVHFEEIIRSEGDRRQAFARLLDFMGMPEEDLDALQLDRLPVVQSTLPPQLYRWKRRHDLIAQVLAAPRISELAAHFGYLPETMESWL
jgi:hypothetical protein